MDNTIRSPLAAVTAAERLICVWVPTGNPRGAHICVWLEAKHDYPAVAITSTFPMEEIRSQNRRGVQPCL